MILFPPPGSHRSADIARRPAIVLVKKGKFLDSVLAPSGGRKPNLSIYHFLNYGATCVVVFRYLGRDVVFTADREREIILRMGRRMPAQRDTV